ncbi:protein serine/threonine kinase, putative [Entamoeba invadens IP1]|uniref:protein serine/threonine kinase, putative n=1 Tax=Entamoeba invadens IP1 TaxID=370355 RepID=UPI0002C3DE04|nr:protein serine/threonine kinase, putative [Entamoeba invadens IP1]ELP93171.1 protein serine/threonine kinase, putative [Entamoeba invadens IP1]|eukprot:XP_004259942.1 protein serine/threonine kinase, putative [Entamoeba invadens IP1]
MITTLIILVHFVSTKCYADVAKVPVESLTSLKQNDEWMTITNNISCNQVNTITGVRVKLLSGTIDLTCVKEVSFLALYISEDAALRCGEEILFMDSPVISIYGKLEANNITIENGASLIFYISTHMNAISVKSSATLLVKGGSNVTINAFLYNALKPVVICEGCIFNTKTFLYLDDTESGGGALEFGENSIITIEQIVLSAQQVLTLGKNMVFSFQHFVVRSQASLIAKDNVSFLGGDNSTFVSHSNATNLFGKNNTIRTTSITIGGDSEGIKMVGSNEAMDYTILNIQQSTIECNDFRVVNSYIDFTVQNHITVSNVFQVESSQINFQTKNTLSASKVIVDNSNITTFKDNTIRGEEVLFSNTPMVYLNTSNILKASKIETTFSSVYVDTNNTIETVALKLYMTEFKLYDLNTLKATNCTLDKVEFFANRSNTIVIDQYLDLMGDSFFLNANNTLEANVVTTGIRLTLTIEFGNVITTKSFVSSSKTTIVDGNSVSSEHFEIAQEVLRINENNTFVLKQFVMTSPSTFFTRAFNSFEGDIVRLDGIYMSSSSDLFWNFTRMEIGGFNSKVDFTYNDIVNITNIILYDTSTLTFSLVQSIYTNLFLYAYSNVIINTDCNIYGSILTSQNYTRENQQTLTYVSHFQNTGDFENVTIGGFESFSFGSSSNVTIKNLHIIAGGGVYIYGETNVYIENLVIDNKLDNGNIAPSNSVLLSIESNARVTIEKLDQRLQVDIERNGDGQIFIVDCINLNVFNFSGLPTPEIPILNFLKEKVPDKNIFSYSEIQNCFDAAVFAEPNYESELFKTMRVDDVLIRMCPPNMMDYKLTCLMSGNVMKDYTYGDDDFSFTQINCPCNRTINSRCAIQLLNKESEITVDTPNINAAFLQPMKSLVINEGVEVTGVVEGFFKELRHSDVVIHNVREVNESDYFNEVIQVKFESDGLTYTVPETANEGLRMGLQPNSRTFKIRTNAKIVYFSMDPEDPSRKTSLNDLRRKHAVQKDVLQVEKTLDGISINSNSQSHFIYFKTSPSVAMFSQGFMFNDDEKRELYHMLYYNKGYYRVFENLKGEYCHSFFGLHLNVTERCEVTVPHCVDEFKGICYRCEDGYSKLSNNTCVVISECKQTERDFCVECENGYLLDDECHRCDTLFANCSTCSATSCKICSNDTMLSKSSDSGLCVSDVLSTKVSNLGIVSCYPEYFLLDNACVLCSSKYSNCKLCTQNSCEKCFNEYEVGVDGLCRKKCTVTSGDYEQCSKCEDGYSLNEGGKCVTDIQGCSKYGAEGECLMCSTDLVLSFDKQKCNVNRTEDCEISKESLHCVRCWNHTFLQYEDCSDCDSSCTACFGTDKTCLSCNETSFVSNHTCYLHESLIGKCQIFHKLTGGCVKCTNGYYRFEFQCEKCDPVCATCVKSGSCILCNSERYMSCESVCRLKSEIVGCATEISSENGCEKCQDGYYSSCKVCLKCDAQCYTCTKPGRCDGCASDKVLINGECVDQIEKCTTINGSKCVSCDFLYKPSSNGTICEKRSLWWISLIAIFFVILVVGVVAIILWQVIGRIAFIHAVETEETTKKKDLIFDIKKSNIQMKEKITENVVCDRKEIIFAKEQTNVNEDFEIEVDNESTEMVHIANVGNYVQKVQVIPKINSEKFKITVSPDFALLKKNMACKFSVTIQPYCSCHVTTQILIIAKSLKTCNEKKFLMNVEAKTVLSSKLDPEEIKEEYLIAEGPFGTVYLATFRAAHVIVKKVKNAQMKGTDLSDFENEVKMLEKFRCNYIITFLGAVFIPSKTCIVMEYAKHGSLQNLIANAKKEDIQFLLKVKFMVDSAKGIEYLHDNGILHRDIKPDNILIVSLLDEDNEQVNAKLTDFGASRNINRMMTNMTFTRNVGTPKYMAPEILNGLKYSNKADIFSFAITMYECFTWGDAFVSFPNLFPWDVAGLIAKNYRPPLDIVGNKKVEDIIERAWDQEQKDRANVGLVLSSLLLVN